MEDLSHSKKMDCTTFVELSHRRRVCSIIPINNYRAIPCNMSFLLMLHSIYRGLTVSCESLFVDKKFLFDDVGAVIRMLF